MYVRMYVRVYVYVHCSNHVCPYFASRTKELCDGVTDVNLGRTCGRPLGFSFNSLTGVLYIMDAFTGLYQLGPQGGQATLIANSAGGVSFNFPNGVDVDQVTGDVYITDASLTFDLRYVFNSLMVANDT